MIDKEKKINNENYLKKKRAQKKDTCSNADEEFTIKLIHLNRSNNKEKKDEDPKNKKSVIQTMDDKIESDVKPIIIHEEIENLEKEGTILCCNVRSR